MERSPRCRRLRWRPERRGHPSPFQQLLPKDEKLSWSRILVACSSGRDPRRVVHSWAVRGPQPRHLHDKHVWYALRRVAGELGTEALSIPEYGAHREALLRRQRRRLAPDLLDALLPNSEQIIVRFGSWPAALSFAGLRPRERSTFAHSRHELGMPIAEAMIVFVENNSRYPRKRELQRYMKDCGARLANTAGQPWSRCLDAAEAPLRERGLPVPAVRPRTTAGPPPMNERSYRLPPGRRIPGAPRSRVYWTRERCLEALREYLTHLRPGQDGRLRHYERLLQANGWPVHPTLRKHGSFQELLAEARQLQREAQADEGAE